MSNTDTKDNGAVVRIDRDQYEAIRERAEAEQRTIKVVLRKVLDEALGTEPDDFDQPADAS